MVPVVALRARVFAGGLVVAVGGAVEAELLDVAGAAFVVSGARTSGETASADIASRPIRCLLETRDADCANRYVLCTSKVIINLSLEAP